MAFYQFFLIAICFVMNISAMQEVIKKTKNLLTNTTIDVTEKKVVKPGINSGQKMHTFTLFFEKKFLEQKEQFQNEDIKCFITYPDQNLKPPKLDVNGKTEILFKKDTVENNTDKDQKRMKRMYHKPVIIQDISCESSQFTFQYIERKNLAENEYEFYFEVNKIPLENITETPAEEIKNLAKDSNQVTNHTQNNKIEETTAYDKKNNPSNIIFEKTKKEEDKDTDVNVDNNKVNTLTETSHNKKTSNSKTSDKFKATTDSETKEKSEKVEEKSNTTTKSDDMNKDNHYGSIFIIIIIVLGAVGCFIFKKYLSYESNEKPSIFDVYDILEAQDDFTVDFKDVHEKPIASGEELMVLNIEDATGVIQVQNRNHEKFYVEKEFYYLLKKVQPNFFEGNILEVTKAFKIDAEEEEEEESYEFSKDDELIITNVITKAMIPAAELNEEYDAEEGMGKTAKKVIGIKVNSSDYAWESDQFISPQYFFNLKCQENVPEQDEEFSQNKIINHQDQSFRTKDYAKFQRLSGITTKKLNLMSKDVGIDSTVENISKSTTEEYSFKEGDTVKVLYDENLPPAEATIINMSDINNITLHFVEHGELEGFHFDELMPSNYRQSWYDKRTRNR